jgi:hypothetical protein
MARDGVELVVLTSQVGAPCGCYELDAIDRRDGPVRLGAGQLELAQLPATVALETAPFEVGDRVGLVVIDEGRHLEHSAVARERDQAVEQSGPDPLAPVFGQDPREDVGIAMLGGDRAPGDAAGTHVLAVDLRQQVELGLATGTLGAQSGERELLGFHGVADRQHPLEVGIGRRGPVRQVHGDRIIVSHEPGSRSCSSMARAHAGARLRSSSGRGAVW